MQPHARSTQSAAIPYRRTASGEIEVLLVTSRRRKRWVLPKGKIKQGLLPNASAAREAFEEAGVIGQIETTPLGTYRQGKVQDDGVVDLVRVTAFVMEVSAAVPQWPEMRTRKRKWMPLSEAIKEVGDRELRQLLERFADIVRCSAEGH